MKKFSKRQLWALLVTVFCVAITLILMVSAYNAGIEKGRNETVDMINEDLSDYTFTIRDNDGWVCGLLSHGTKFPGSNWDDCLHTDYNWDNEKIIFSYEHH